jgi:hypothetical protein
MKDITAVKEAESDNMSNTSDIQPATHAPLTTQQTVAEEEPNFHPALVTRTTTKRSHFLPTPEKKDLPWYSLKPDPWYRPVVLLLMVLYMANVIAWGGMLFLLLVEAAPAMCHPTCNDLYSPRRIWIETDSQILNALFCVTGFGLSPWRFRDMYFMAQKYFGPKEGRERATLRLAGYHTWFRLGRDLPEEKARELQANVRQQSYFSIHWRDTDPQTQPPSGFPPPQYLATSPPWKLPTVVILNFLNTVFQICLVTFMWHDNRFVRPSWSTGFFVACGCVVGIAAGVIQGMEGGRSSKVEKGIDPKAKKDKKKKKKGEKDEEKANVDIEAQPVSSRLTST